MYSKRKIIEGFLNADDEKSVGMGLIKVADENKHIERSLYSTTELVCEVDNNMYVVKKTFFEYGAKKEEYNIHNKGSLIQIKNGVITTGVEVPRTVRVYRKKKLLKKMAKKISKAINKELGLTVTGIVYDKIYEADGGEYVLSLFLCINDDEKVRGWSNKQKIVDIMKPVVEKELSKYHEKTGNYITLGTLHSFVYKNMSVSFIINGCIGETSVRVYNMYVKSKLGDVFSNV